MSSLGPEMSNCVQGHTNLIVPLVLFAICAPLLGARPLTFLACLRRGRDKEQLNAVISMDRFILEHRVFLYDCNVKWKCKSGRRCQKKLRSSPNIPAPHRNSIDNLVKKL
jgi:hypothetical protein